MLMLLTAIDLVLGRQSFSSSPKMASPLVFAWFISAIRLFRPMATEKLPKIRPLLQLKAIRESIILFWVEALCLPGTACLGRLRKVLTCPMFVTVDRTARTLTLRSLTGVKTWETQPTMVIEALIDTLNKARIVVPLEVERSTMTLIMVVPSISMMGEQTVLQKPACLTVVQSLLTYWLQWCLTQLLRFRVWTAWTPRSALGIRLDIVVVVWWPLSRVVSTCARIRWANMVNSGSISSKTSVRLAPPMVTIVTTERTW